MLAKYAQARRQPPPGARSAADPGAASRRSWRRRPEQDPAPVRSRGVRDADSESAWRDAGGRLVDSGKPRGGRLPRGPNPRTSLARRLLRSPCATPHVRCRAEGFFISGPSRAAARARPQARNASESGDDSDGRQGRTASLTPGTASPAPLSGRPRVVGPPTEPIEVTGAQSLVTSLECVGVDTVFGIPGGAILPAYDPLMDSTKVRHILVRHEQGAGHAAEGYASATGQVGVCMATSGPGRHQPGHADRRRLHGLGADGRHHRPGRRASRSAPTPSRRRTSAASRCRSPSTTSWSPTRRLIPRAIAEAFHIAATGPPGPGARRHLQGRAAGQHRPSTGRRRSTCPATARSTRPHGKQVREAARLIVEARRPVLYVGGGVIRPGRQRAAAPLAELTGIPVVTTLMARGARSPTATRCTWACPGMHGTVAAVAALQKADLLVALGARFDDRVTGQLSTFAPSAKVIHADIDPAEICKNRTADVPIVGDAKEVIAELIAAVEAEQRGRQAPATTRRGGSSSLRLARHLPARLRRPPTTARSPRSTSSSGSAPSSGPEAIYAAGVGQHQMWAAQFIKYEQPEHLAQLRRRWARWATRCRRPWAPRSAEPDAHGLGHRRRRLLPDDQPGARHLRDQRHPDQGRGHQQLQPRHGPPVADAVLRRALLQHRPAHRPRARIPDFVKLAEAYGCVGLRCESPERRRRDDREGDGDQRRPGGRRLRRPPRRDGVADGRRRHQQRRHQGRARHGARSGTERTRPHEPSTPSPSWSRTSPASSPASPACSPGAASTSTPSRSAPPSTPTSRG